jgi:hypothetical protein
LTAAQFCLAAGGVTARFVVKVQQATAFEAKNRGFASIG